MANTALSGLFGGSSELDVLDLMRREEEAASKQARAFPTSTASIAAAAQQDRKNALKKMFGGVAGGLGLDVAVDPRLANARKREMDKRYILKILEGYRSDGVIDETEIEKGWSLLVSMGYLEEAKEFRLKSESILKKTSRNTSSKSGPVGVGQPVTIKTQKQANKASKEIGQQINIGDQVSQITHYDNKSEKYTARYVPYIGKPNKKSFMGTDLRVQEVEDTEAVKGIEERKTIKFREKLERKTNELKQLLNIEEHSAKELASINLKDRAAIIDSGLTAVEDLPKLKALVELARERKAGKTGGELQAAFRRLGRAFGFEDKPFADFRVGSQNLMIENLKRIFGPRATDKDMEELKKAFANENQTYEGNVSILESLLKKYEQEVDNTTFLTNNPLASKKDLFEYVRGGRFVPTEAANKLLKEERARLKNNPKEWKKITKQYRNLYGQLALKKALKDRD